ncbi:OmpA family protein [Pelagovum pacificum]|uniref:OmpA family protein n=1 Tax=Pelagovum pacificum TaxID=2588711 RepID=A0A5C5GGR5_9RHOB|nr:OmpA family protein [Pelagovum pacificum]QQA43449.1 OmpA family protein [Pelagovum pacificum]TNY33414.1 OmpA family protein [Pelagovum pacificum]
MNINRTPVALSLVALMAVTACSDMRDENNPNRNTQTGAAGGAALGALIGAATAGDDPADRNRAIATGALVGGAIGAGVGYSLDRQEAELRQQLGGNVGVENTGSNLVVTLPQDILFATDSATLSGALQSDLAALARNLNQYPSTSVTVIGHTDNTGEAAYNQNLSRNRAQAVTASLVTNGVAPGRINTVGRGEDEPIATNLTEEGRAQNRRVEIIINPPAS